MSKLTPLASPQPGSPYRQWPCGPLPTPNWRRAGLSLAIRLISAALLATQTWQIVETSGGLRFAKAAAQAQTPAPTPTAAAATPATEAAPATVGYDAVYGGVSQTTTADDTALTLTRDADGYSPVAIAYSGTSAGTLTFQYAPGDGRTVESDGAATTHLVYAGDYLPMAEFDGGAAPATRYHFPGQGQLTNYSQGGSGQLAVSADGSELFAVTDRLGSTRALLSAGAVQARFDYDMLGKPTETDNCSSACPAREYAYRYQSHRYILLASAGDQAGYQPGLQDFRARFYDHGQGRFLNTDLAGVSISPYSAMANDWVNRVDLDGMVPMRRREPNGGFDNGNAPHNKRQRTMLTRLGGARLNLVPVDFNAPLPPTVPVARMPAAAPPAPVDDAPPVEDAPMFDAAPPVDLASLPFPLVRVSRPSPSDASPSAAAPASAPVEALQGYQEHFHTVSTRNYDEWWEVAYAIYDEFFRDQIPHRRRGTHNNPAEMARIQSENALNTARIIGYLLPSNFGVHGSFLASFSLAYDLAEVQRGEDWDDYEEGDGPRPLLPRLSGNQLNPVAVPPIGDRLPNLGGAPRTRLGLQINNGTLRVERVLPNGSGVLIEVQGPSAQQNPANAPTRPADGGGGIRRANDPIPDRNAERMRSAASSAPPSWTLPHD